MKNNTKIKDVMGKFVSWIKKPGHFIPYIIIIFLSLAFSLKTEDFYPSICVVLFLISMPHIRCAVKNRNNRSKRSDAALALGVALFGFGVFVLTAHVFSVSFYIDMNQHLLVFISCLLFSVCLISCVLFRKYKDKIGLSVLFLLLFVSCFGFIYVSILQCEEGSFSFVSESEPLVKALNFFWYSISVMFGGFSKIEPKSDLARGVSNLEIFLYLFYIANIISAFIEDRAKSEDNKNPNSCVENVPTVDMEIPYSGTKKESTPAKSADSKEKPKSKNSKKK